MVFLTLKPVLLCDRPLSGCIWMKACGQAARNDTERRQTHKKKALLLIEFQFAEQNSENDPSP